MTVCSSCLSRWTILRALPDAAVEKFGRLELPSSPPFSRFLSLYSLFYRSYTPYTAPVHLPTAIAPPHALCRRRRTCPASSSLASRIRMEGDSLNVPTFSAPQDAATMMMGTLDVSLCSGTLLIDTPTSPPPPLTASLPGPCPPVPCHNPPGPSQIAYQAQAIIFAFFVSQFYNYCKSGEMASHNKAGRVALWVSLVLNFVYTALCVYENYIAAGTSSFPFSVPSISFFRFRVPPSLAQPLTSPYTP